MIGREHYQSLPLREQVTLLERALHEAEQQIAEAKAAVRDAEETAPDLEIGRLFGRPARPLTEEEQGRRAALRELRSRVHDSAAVELAAVHHQIEGSAARARREGAKGAFEAVASMITKRLNSLDAITGGGRAR